MADALFTINADSSNQGFDATASQVLQLRLKTLPVSGVESVRYLVWDATAFDPDDDPIVNPPRKAKDSPSLTLVGATSGANVAPVTHDANVQVTMPGSDNHAWIVRCVVNGGKSLQPDGRLMFDPRLVHERMIVIRDTVTGGRPVVATETTQYEDDGWAPEVGRAGAQGPAGADGDDVPLATGTDDGFLQRIILTPADDGLVWANAAAVPDGGDFEFIPTGAGGGAGGGAAIVTTNTTANGGSGGGGGARPPSIRVPRAWVIARLPITFVIGTGGAGGAGRTQTGSGTSNGFNGASGSKSTRMLGGSGELLLFAGAGIGGNGGGIATNGGGGGGCLTAGSAGTGGRPADKTSSANDWQFGGTDGNVLTTASSRHGGGGGAPYQNGNGIPGKHSVFGGGGGASGGRGQFLAAGGPGAIGGHHDPGEATAVGAGAAGAAGNLGHGGNGADGDDLKAGCGGGSGGGFGDTDSGTRAGDGGNGGNPGGGGGGGGGSHDQSPAVSGDGGDGGNGEIRIIIRR